MEYRELTEKIIGCAYHVHPVKGNDFIDIKNYAQVLRECAKRYDFSEEEQEKLSKLAIQRNRLAHRYLNFRWEAISMFAELKPLVTKLLEKILKRESGDRKD